MSSGDTLPVAVEWAVWGSETSGGRAVLLSCSDGPVRAGVFEEVLLRYSPGTLAPDDLPQVTVSWFGNDTDRRYIAIGLHHQAESARLNRDARSVLLTSYFCIPFSAAADGAISYLTMYERFRQVALPLEPPRPMTTELRVRPTAAVSGGVSPLAMRAAALLITDRPVCVLGAHHVEVVDRLRFIEAVASLLPYGLRSRLSASTWASSTYRTHKFRLFFANAERGQSDLVVTWGQSPGGRIGDAFADEYVGLLADGVLTPDLLAGFGQPMGFDRTAIMRLLEQAHSRSRRRPRAPSRADEKEMSPLRPAAMPDELAITRRSAADTNTVRDAPPVEPDLPARTLEPERPAFAVEPELPGRMQPAEPQAVAALPADVRSARQVLGACASALAAGESDRLERAIAELRRLAREPTEADRREMAKLAAELHLFSPSEGIDEAVLERLYRELLPRVFVLPLRYGDYLELERVASGRAGERLHHALAATLLAAQVAGPTRLLVLNSFGDPELETALASYPVAPVDLVAMMVDDGLDRAHAKILQDVAAKILRQRSDVSASERAGFATAISQQKLMVALQERALGTPEYRLNLFTEILAFAGDGAMDHRQARTILSESGRSVSVPLLGAILRLSRPASRTSVMRDFAVRCLATAGFDAQTFRELRDLTSDKALQAPTPSATTSSTSAVSASSTGYGRRASSSASKRRTVSPSRRRSPIRDWLIFVATLALMVLSIIGLVNFFIRVWP
jgi:hypothetical protein